MKIYKYPQNFISNEIEKGTNFYETEKEISAYINGFEAAMRFANKISESDFYCKDCGKLLKEQKHIPNVCDACFKKREDEKNKLSEKVKQKKLKEKLKNKNKKLREKEKEKEKLRKEKLKEKERLRKEKLKANNKKKLK